MSKGSEATQLRTPHDPVFLWPSGKGALIKIATQIKGQGHSSLWGLKTMRPVLTLEKEMDGECDLCQWSSESRKGLWEDALQGGGSSNARGTK